MHQNMEDQKCCFHPEHGVIGVCAFCLNERLLILASKQEHGVSNFPKLFGFTSLLNPFDNHRHIKKTEDDHDNYSGASTSQEDSFISIKFEGGGVVGSWEKTTDVPKVSIEQCDNTSLNKTLKEEFEGATALIQHSKTRGLLKWRKRIGHLFQVIRWKRPVNKASNVGPKLEGVKVRHGWIRSLTKRRTMV